MNEYNEFWPYSKMKQQLGQLALLVSDYDEAIRYYTDVLDFELLEDTVMSESKRWVRVAPPGSSCHLLLAKAANEAQQKQIGFQAGGRVFLFLYTDDFWRDYRKYTSRGVEFVREPAKEAYGTVSVFKDLYGNLWDLIEPK
jgi:catechol 2,3-dioxygenase-like lactoylglutathione lyase family enzyme